MLDFHLIILKKNPPSISVGWGNSRGGECCWVWGVWDVLCSCFPLFNHGNFPFQKKTNGAPNGFYAEIDWERYVSVPWSFPAARGDPRLSPHSFWALWVKSALSRHQFHACRSSRIPRNEVVLESSVLVEVYPEKTYYKCVFIININIINVCINSYICINIIYKIIKRD